MFIQKINSFCYVNFSVVMKESKYYCLCISSTYCPEAIVTLAKVTDDDVKYSLLYHRGRRVSLGKWWRDWLSALSKCKRCLLGWWVLRAALELIKGRVGWCVHHHVFLAQAPCKRCWLIKTRQEWHRRMRGWSAALLSKHLIPLILDWHWTNPHLTQWTILRRGWYWHGTLHPTIVSSWRISSFLLVWRTMVWRLRFWLWSWSIAMVVAMAVMRVLCDGWWHPFWRRLGWKTVEVLYWTHDHGNVVLVVGCSVSCVREAVGRRIWCRVPNKGVCIWWIKSFPVMSGLIVLVFGERHNCNSAVFLEEGWVNEDVWPLGCAQEQDEAYAGGWWLYKRRQ